MFSRFWKFISLENITHSWNETHCNRTQLLLGNTCETNFSLFWKILEAKTEDVPQAQRPPHPGLHWDLQSWWHVSVQREQTGHLLELWYSSPQHPEAGNMLSSCLSPGPHLTKQPYLHYKMKVQWQPHKCSVGCATPGSKPPYFCILHCRQPPCSLSAGSL